MGRYNPIVVHSEVYTKNAFADNSAGAENVFFPKNVGVSPKKLVPGVPFLLVAPGSRLGAG